MTGDLRRKLIQQFHGSTSGDHSGVLHAYQRMKNHFYWKGMKKQLENFIKECDICAQNKPDAKGYQGILQPLPIPTQIWEDISMDFVEALPISEKEILSWLLWIS